jgi:hypothetical protein
VEQRLSGNLRLAGFDMAELYVAILFMAKLLVTKLLVTKLLVTKLWETRIRRGQDKSGPGELSSLRRICLPCASWG